MGSTLYAHSSRHAHTLRCISFFTFLGSIIAQTALYSTPDSHNPLAPHQLIVVDVGGEALIEMDGYDLDGDDISATLEATPTSYGTVHQLSKVFSDYGYEPKQGKQITSRGQKVTGSLNRILYKRPRADFPSVGAWDVLSYTVSDLTPLGKVKSTSEPGLITLVPPSGLLVASHFTRDAESWTIQGNKAPHGVTYEASSRGALNHYVYGSDDTINTDETKANSDRSLWYFQAPSKFHGHHGIAYGGTLEFTLSSFHGDFTAENQNAGLDGQSGLHLVEIHCSQCNVNRGVTIAFPLSQTQGFDGSTTVFRLPLRETAGWVLDPKNTLIQWSPPTQCQFIEVLSGMTSFKILGDFTKWYESVALDTVQLKNTQAQIPICAQQRPDASGCTCAALDWKKLTTATY